MIPLVPFLISYASRKSTDLAGSQLTFNQFHEAQQNKRENWSNGTNAG
jgi:hypothetical protein